MSAASSVLARIGRLPTVWRTLRAMRFAQAVAQVRHLLVGLPSRPPLLGTSAHLAIETPQTHFLPPPAHVKGDPRRIELLATHFVLEDRVDWETGSRGPLFAYHLHQQEYLRLVSFDAAARARVILDWIERHPRGIGWDPHPISLRLLCWGRLLLTPGALGGDPGPRDRMLHSMAIQAESLARGLEIRLQANHLLSNLIGVVWSGLLLEVEVERPGALAWDALWRGHADQLIEELDAQIHPDGGHEERSPMYHALLLENILDLLNLCLAAGERAPTGLSEALSSTANRMLVALAVWTHRDGRIALFADSGFDVSAEPEDLVDYAQRLGVGRPDPVEPAFALLPQSGYLRLSAGPVDLIASVAGPSPRHQPGHAHCDALAFELSIGGMRLVTDAGVYEYQLGARRDRARATASHATLEIDGQEQAEIWAAHRIGGRPDVALSAWDESGSAEATCRGWSRGAALHRRLFRVSQTQVEIVDSVEGACDLVVSRLPIDAGWVVEQADGLVRARRVAPDGRECVVRFDLPQDFAWSVERAPSYPSFGREVDRPVLVGRGNRPRESTIQISIEQ